LAYDHALRCQADIALLIDLVCPVGELTGLAIFWRELELRVQLLQMGGVDEHAVASAAMSLGEVRIMLLKELDEGRAITEVMVLEAQRPPVGGNHDLEALSIG